MAFDQFQGSNLDSNAKMWRLVADFMNDLGILLHNLLIFMNINNILFLLEDFSSMDNYCNLV